MAYKEHNKVPLPKRLDILKRSHNELIDVELGSVASVALITEVGMVEVTPDNVVEVRAELRRHWGKKHRSVFARNNLEKILPKVAKIKKDD